MRTLELCKTARFRAHAFASRESLSEAIAYCAYVLISSFPVPSAAGDSESYLRGRGQSRGGSLLLYFAPVREFDRAEFSISSPGSKVRVVAQLSAFKTTAGWRDLGLVVHVSLIASRPQAVKGTSKSGVDSPRPLTISVHLFSRPGVPCVGRGPNHECRSWPIQDEAHPINLRVKVCTIARQLN